MNAVVKLIAHHATFKYHSAAFYTTKTKAGKKQKVSSTYTSLSQSNKDAVRSMLHETTPDSGPWFEIISLSRKCDEAFDDFVAAVRHRGMPANRIACISHILYDEHFLACNIPLSDTVGSSSRPAKLDH